MCTVDIDKWHCRNCFQHIETSERIPSWKTCDIGPTYDKACPAYAPSYIFHFNFECDGCQRAAAAEAAAAAEEAVWAAESEAEKQKFEGEGSGSRRSSHTLGRSSPIDPQLERESKGDDRDRTIKSYGSDEQAKAWVNNG